MGGGQFGGCRAMGRPSARVVPVDAVAAVAGSGRSGRRAAGGWGWWRPPAADGAPVRCGGCRPRGGRWRGCWGAWRGPCQATRREARRWRAGHVPRAAQRYRTACAIHRRMCVRCAFAGSGDSARRCQAGLVGVRALGSGRGVAVAEGAEQLLDGDVEGVGEGVPGREGAGGAALFDVDEGAPGQAAAARRVRRRSSRARPSAAPAHTQRGEVRVGRQDRHPTIRRCRHPALSVQTSALFAQVDAGAPAARGQRSALRCGRLPAPAPGAARHAAGADGREEQRAA